LHDRILGSLGRRLLMTCTQQPNTMAPESTLCICSRKWKAKLIVPLYFGKKSKFCFRIIYFSSLKSKLSFDSEELWEQFAIFQATTGRTSLRTSCLYFRNGKPDWKWRSSQTKAGEKIKDCLGRQIRHLNTGFLRLFIAHLQEFPFTVVVSENVFCQGLIFVLDPVWVLLSGMFHV